MGRSANAPDSVVEGVGCDGRDICFGRGGKSSQRELDFPLTMTGKLTHLDPTRPTPKRHRVEADGSLAYLTVQGAHKRKRTPVRKSYGWLSS